MINKILFDIDGNYLWIQHKDQIVDGIDIVGLNISDLLCHGLDHLVKAKLANCHKTKSRIRIKFVVRIGDIIRAVTGFLTPSGDNVMLYIIKIFDKQTTTPFHEFLFKKSVDKPKYYLR